MKSTDDFKAVIQNHLESLAAKDELFAETLKKPKKSIDECISYILTEVQKSGCNGFADEEIFKMAVHYYDEDDLKPGNAPDCRVVVNHTVELSPEEIENAKQAAMDKVIEEQKAQLKSKKSIKKPEQNLIVGSLFD